jgi:hypothetical protein
MRRTKILLLVVGALVAAAIVNWQRSSDAASAVRPAAAQLSVPETPATSQKVAPVEQANDETVVAPSEKRASAVTRKPAPTRVIRRDLPVAPPLEPTRPATPTAPDTVNVTAARPSYEGRVADAIILAGEDSDRALLSLQQLTAGEPGRPEAYEAMAGIRLRQRDYRQARELIGSALRNGGKATFTLIHDHSRGNFEKADPKATCVGELTILANAVRFEGPGERDRFAASWTEVRNTGANKFFGSGIGGFHVTITSDGKYQNFNLAPESRDKAEGKLILELLTAYTRRLDRAK